MRHARSKAPAIALRCNPRNVEDASRVEGSPCPVQHDIAHNNKRRGPEEHP